MMYRFRAAVEGDRKAVTSVFNYFVEHSFAAFPEEKVDTSFYDRMANIAKGYPFYVIETDENGVVGFALLHPYHGAPTLRRTAVATYFILPEHTGQGLGTQVLNRFISEARAMGIDTLLASISSLNEGSINFHLLHGFVECARFQRIGVKKGRDFDVVWMQKFI